MVRLMVLDSVTRVNAANRESARTESNSLTFAFTGLLRADTLRLECVDARPRPPNLIGIILEKKSPTFTGIKKRLDQALPDSPFGRSLSNGGAA